MREVFENIPEAFVTKTATYDQKVPITSILGDVNKFGAVVITKDKEYYGIIDHRTLARSSTLRVDEKFTSGKFARKVPVITNTASVADAINLFYQSASKALPYLKGNAIAGIVKRDEILKAVLSMHLLSKTRVNQIMSTPIIGVDSGISIATAVKIMADNRINRLAVFSEGKLFGILTRSNVVKYSSKTLGRSPEVLTSAKIRQGTVGEICERSVHAISHNDKAEDAIRELVNRKISSLLVLRNNKPVGVVTIRDILESVIKGWQTKEDKIILTGFDRRDEQYKEDVAASISKMLDKINRFGKFTVDYASVNVKRIKQKGYEVKARVALGKRGVMHVSVSGYTLDKTMKVLDSRLYKLVEEEKDTAVTSRKEAGAKYDYEEE